MDEETDECYLEVKNRNFHISVFIHFFGLNGTDFYHFFLTKKKGTLSIVILFAINNTIENLMQSAMRITMTVLI